MTINLRFYTGSGTRYKRSGRLAAIPQPKSKKLRKVMFERRSRKFWLVEFGREIRKGDFAASEDAGDVS
jgi:hypothetical protein